MPDPRMTLQTRLVLKAMLDKRHRHGLALCDETGLLSGTVYPILARLERAGWVASTWEEPQVQEVQHRPRRRYYWLTPDGAQKTAEALAATYRSGRKSSAPSLRPQGGGA